MLHHHGPRERLVRAARPAPADVWPEWGDAPEGGYRLVPLSARLGLDIRADRFEPAGLGGAADHAIEEVERTFPRHADSGDDWLGAGHLPGSVGAADESANAMVRTLVPYGAWAGEDEGNRADDWTNLLAISSVGSMQWGDAGSLYLLVRRGDLSRGDFSRVRMTTTG